MASINVKRAETTYTLELSPAEVAALYVVLMNVGGPPETSPRGQTDAVLNAISKSVPGLSEYEYRDDMTEFETLEYLDGYMHFRRASLEKFSGLVKAFT